MSVPSKWLLLPFLAITAMAQSKTTASVRGIVQDASEARVTQVRVILTNSATNAKFETPICCRLWFRGSTAWRRAKPALRRGSGTGWS